MHLVGQDDIKVPSELLWRLLLRRQFEKRNDLKETAARIADVNIFNATGALVDRYDIPRYWFEELVCEGGNNNPIDFKFSDKSRKTRRRKTWTKMYRDLSIYCDHLLGKSVREIYTLIKNEFGEDLDYGNIKKIISDVRHRKLDLKEI